MALPVRVERSHPFDPFDIVRNDLDMIGRFLGISDPSDGGSVLASPPNYGVDVREDADRIYVEADLPGFRKEDVEISLENGMLTIIAERHEEVTEPLPAERAQQQDQSAQAGEEQQADESQQRRGGRAPQERQAQQRPQNANYLLRERRVQRFVRSFTLPPNVDESSVQARLTDGVLRITLSKHEESKAKRIAVS